jgi:hypothetical protein
MLYAHFMGYLSEIRYSKDNTPFAKSLVRTTSGEELEIRVFGDNNLRDLEYGSLIKVTKAEITSGYWQGFVFYNGHLTGHSKMKLPRPMEFSIANGFDLSSLN